jgi:hypothetical protein
VPLPVLTKDKIQRRANADRRNDGTNDNNFQVPFFIQHACYENGKGQGTPNVNKMNLIDQGNNQVGERNSDDQPNTENKKYNKGRKLKALTVLQVGGKKVNRNTQQGNEEIITAGYLPKQMFYKIHPYTYTFSVTTNVLHL